MKLPKLQLAVGGALGYVFYRNYQQHRRGLPSVFPHPQKAVVLGGGIIGVTTAYYLAREGMDVHIIERGKDIAGETSLGNAGACRLGSYAPVANRASVGEMFKVRSERDSQGNPLLKYMAVNWLHVLVNPFIWEWGLKFLYQSLRRERVESRTEFLRKFTLDGYNELLRVAEQEGITKAAHLQVCSTIDVYRSQSAFDTARAAVEAQTEEERALVGARVISVEEAVEREPCLAGVAGELCGAIEYDHDLVGECASFARALVSVMERRYGVKVSLETEVQGIEYITQRDESFVSGVKTSRGYIGADVFISCVGNESAEMLTNSKMATNVNQFPLRGYSLTLNVPEQSSSDETLPRGLVVDHSQRLYVSRVSPEHVRVAGILEVTRAGDEEPSPAQIAALRTATRSFLPRHDPKAIEEAPVWMGRRPTTVDGVPIVSRTNFTNLFVNTGHSTAGFKLCCASGKLLSKIILDNVTTDEDKEFAEHLSHIRFNY